LRLESIIRKSGEKLKFLAIIILSIALSLSSNSYFVQTSSGKNIKDQENRKKDFKNIEEAKKYLEGLIKEREILVGDFYGINITAYRYVNIFYPLGYIRYRIQKIDEEIVLVKKEIEKLKSLE